MAIDVKERDRPDAKTDDDIAVDIVDIKLRMDAASGEVQQVVDHEHGDDQPAPAHRACGIIGLNDVLIMIPLRPAALSSYA